MTPRTFEPTVYQTFTVKTDPSNVAPRLKALRAELKTAGLDAFLIPRADAHRGESVPPGEARLAYVTGFTGSAGIAVVGLKKAGLFIDSRYVIQAPAQTDTKHVDVHLVPQASLSGKIADYVTAGRQDRLRPLAAHARPRSATSPKSSATARRSSPAPTSSTASGPTAPPRRSPRSSSSATTAPARPPQDKLADLRKALGEDKADAAVLTLPESICWLFNMRARDVPNTPFVLGFAIIPRTGQPTVYLDKKKITADVRKGLAGVAKLADATTLPAALRQLGAADKRVLLDPATAPVAIIDAIKGVSDAVIIEKRDPVLMAKARKNDAEIGGMREAHRIDGIAMAKFLRWFDEEAPKGNLDEIGIVTALEAFRREEETLRRCQLRHHLRLRPQRRQQPLPRRRKVEPQAEARRADAGRLRRPVPHRHHRHHPHDVDRQGHSRAEGPLHPRSQGHDRHLGLPLPPRHLRRPDRRPRPQRPLAGRRHLRARHRPRRRRLPLASTRARPASPRATPCRSKSA